MSAVHLWAVCLGKENDWLCYCHIDHVIIGRYSDGIMSVSMHFGLCFSVVGSCFGGQLVNWWCVVVLHAGKSSIHYGCNIEITVHVSIPFALFVCWGIHLFVCMLGCCLLSCLSVCVCLFAYLLDCSIVLQTEMVANRLSRMCMRTLSRVPRRKETDFHTIILTTEYWSKECLKMYVFDTDRGDDETNN